MKMIDTLENIGDNVPVELFNLMSAIDDGIEDMWGAWAVPEWEVEWHESDGCTSYSAYVRTNLTDITLEYRA